jgi:hypothetical protein
LEWEFEPGGGGGNEDPVSISVPIIEVYNHDRNLLTGGMYDPDPSHPLPEVTTDSTGTLYVRIIGSDGDYTITYY